MIRNIEERIEWEVSEEHAGERLDKHVAEELGDDVSRTQVQQWVKEGLVTVNGRAAKANTKLAPGDRIRVDIPEPEILEVLPEAIPLDVVYEDADVIVVNKPRGMVVHPAPGHTSGTLVNALLHHCRDLSGINGVLRPGIVHRIDKDTSGLIMAAKNDYAHQSLAAQLKAHSVTRKYTAIVHGQLEHRQGTVDAPIGRDEKDRKLYTVTSRNSKRAVTHFAVLELLPAHTLLELTLETGRTHQIRVHMKHIGHPLVGDPLYGSSRQRIDKRIQGQALHAGVLGFTHPRSGERLTFEVPMPDDMRELLELLRGR
jgi:23S rRNA pseudouridine1911/1915/1917 synthase